MLLTTDDPTKKLPGLREGAHYTQWKMASELVTTLLQTALVLEWPYIQYNWQHLMKFGDQAEESIKNTVSPL